MNLPNSPLLFRICLLFRLYHGHAPPTTTLLTAVTHIRFSQCLPWLGKKGHACPCIPPHPHHACRGGHCHSAVHTRLYTQVGLTSLAPNQGHIYHRLHAPITCPCWYVHIYILLVYNAPSVPHCNELEVPVPVSQSTMQWAGHMLALQSHPTLRPVSMLSCTHAWVADAMHHSCSQITYTHMLVTVRLNVQYTYMYDASCKVVVYTLCKLSQLLQPSAHMCMWE